MYFQILSEAKCVVTPYNLSQMIIAEGIRKNMNAFEIADSLSRNMFAYMETNNLKIEVDKSDYDELLFSFKEKN